MFWSTATGAALLVGCAWLLDESLVPASTGGWIACAALGIVHVAGQGSIAWALGKLPAATASVTVLVQPVVAAVLGWVVFGERLGFWQSAGAAIALSGVLLAQRSAIARTVRL
jgi:drug/metabolite transporter (DMT)-like permease